MSGDPPRPAQPAPVGVLDTEPPDRPAAWEDLRWRRQKPVRWFNPGVLAQAGTRVVLDTAFGAYLDKRELQVAMPATYMRLDDREEVWIDYVADSGDGFDATYSIASLVGRPDLDIPGVPGPDGRADLLVLGGDEVYPTASATAYEQRFLGPYTAAFPWSSGPAPLLVALPGNHDWYDGLTSFMRTFAQQKRVGGWQTTQTRSYFSALLPNRWWLWGVDADAGTYVDEPQLRYFESLDVQEADRIILCVSEPSWVDTPHDPEAYRNLAYIDRKLVRPRGARICLTLSGDSHHYARYQGADGTHHVTAGGGGAFLHPTHGLPGKLELSFDPDEKPVKHTLEQRYPGAGPSRWGAAGALLLGLRNPSFLLLGLVLAVVLFTADIRAASGSIRAAGADGPAVGYGELLASAITRPHTLTVLALLWLALAGFAKPPAPWSHPQVVRLGVKAGLGLVHACLHLLAGAGAAWLGIQTVTSLDGAGGTWLAAGVAAGAGGAGSSLAMGSYLALMNGVPWQPGWVMHSNEAYSAQRLEDRKNFVRMRLARDGTLWLYAIGLDEVGRKWHLAPASDDPDAAWIVPTTPLSPRLVDGPIEITRPLGDAP